MLWTIRHLTLYLKSLYAAYCKTETVNTEYGNIEFPYAFLGVEVNSTKKSLTSGKY